MRPRFTKRPHLRVLAITGLTALVATVTLGAAAPAYGDELLPTDPATEVVEPAPEPAPEPVIEEPPAEPVVEPPAEPVEPPAEPPAEEPVVEPPVDEPVDEPADDPADEPDESDAEKDAADPETAPALTQDIGVLALTGAIFTTNSSCTGVNVNQFTAKTDVYLDGGPQGGGGQGLPDGDYFVKVTEPNGTLLGHVGSGIHVTNGNFDQCYNLFALTAFDDTTNPGGAYKVWVSQSSSFPNNASKTDNFKVLSNPEDLVPNVVTSVIDNRTGSDITNQTIPLPAGESFTVHDTVSVTGSGPTPTGDVTFEFFSNGVCNPESGGVLTTETVALSGGAAASSNSADLPIGTVLEYSYQATYGGDADYLEGLAECEPFFLTIVEANVTPVVPPEVEGTSSAVPTAQLAFTGGGRTWMIPVGLLLVLGGLALFVFYGRRERHSGLGV